MLLLCALRQVCPFWVIMYIHLNLKRSCLQSITFLSLCISLSLSLSPFLFFAPVAPCPLSHSHILMWVQPVYCIMFLFIHLNVSPLFSKFLYCILYVYSICEWILFGKEICYRSLFFWKYTFGSSHWFSFSFFGPFVDKFSAYQPSILDHALKFVFLACHLRYMPVRQLEIAANYF